MIKIYVDVLGLDSLVAENVDLALAELNAMLDELNAKLNALVNELGVRFNNDVLPHVFELLANLEKQIDYITSLPEELKEQALAELNRMLNELKTLIESIINDAITGEYTVDEGSFLVSITGANSEYAQLLAGALGLGERFAIMNWYDIDKALLEKADLVTIGYDYAQIHNFTLTQLLGAVAAYTDESLRAQTIAFLHEVLDGNMENQYIDNYVTRVNDAIDSILEHPVLAGKETILPEAVKKTIRESAGHHAKDILDKLRELQVDLRANPAVFIGGGSILFREYLEKSSTCARSF